MPRDVTVAKFVYSGFDPDLNMFRRQFIGADGIGYDFVRSVEIDRENLLVESAVASDLLAWMRDNPEPESGIVAFRPRPQPARKVKWLPRFRIARTTRSYWRPERQHIYTRAKIIDGDTINIYTPAPLIRQILRVFETDEADLRARVHGPLGMEFQMRRVPTQ